MSNISIWADCPTGFAIPTNLDSERNMYVDRSISDCALMCGYPVHFTKKEYDSLEHMRVTASILSVVMIALVMVVWLTDRHRRSQLFVLSHGGVLFFGLVMLVAISFAVPTSEKVCSSTTEYREAGDSFSACTLEGMAYSYIQLFLATCWCSQGYVLFRRIVLRDANHGRYKVNMSYWMSVIFMFPAILVVLLGCTGVYGSQYPRPICGFSSDANPIITILLFTAPLLLLILLGCGFSLAILVKVISVAKLKVKHATVHSIDDEAASGLGSAPGSRIELPLSRPPVGKELNDSSDIGMSAELAKYDGDQEFGFGDEYFGGVHIMQRIEEGSREQLSSVLEAVPSQSTLSALGTITENAAKSGISEEKDRSRQSSSNTIFLHQPRDVPVLLIGTPLRFLVFSGLFMLLLASGVSFFKFKRLIDADMTWAKCVFQHYDGSTSASYTAICGERPAQIVPVSVLMALVVISHGGFGMFYAVVNIEGLMYFVRTLWLMYAKPLRRVIPHAESSGNTGLMT